MVQYERRERARTEGEKMRDEIKKLGKKELRELLATERAKNRELTEEIEDLRSRVEQAEKEEKVINDAGTLAEASLMLSGIFSAADDAAGKYVENVKRLNNRQEAICAARDESSRKQAEVTVTDARRRAEEMLNEAVDRSKKMLSDAAKKSEELLSAAKRRADDYYADTKAKTDAYVKAQTEFREAISRSDDVLS